MSKSMNTRSRVISPKVQGACKLFTNQVSGSTEAVRLNNLYDLTLDKSAYYDWNGIQLTESEGHKWPPSKETVRGDVGGPFRTSKTYVDCFPRNSTTYGFYSTHWHKYVGDFVCPHPTSNVGGKTKATLVDSYESSDDDLIKAGAEAIALCNPINPVADLSVGLAEVLREGIPSIPGIQAWRSRANLLLGAGKEFLNAEFGWLPLIDEVKKTCKAIRKAHEVIEQFERDAGKLVRREFNFPVEEDASISQYSSSARALMGPIAGQASAYEVVPAGKVVCITERKRKRWFSGAFTYHIPSESNFYDGMVHGRTQADKLLGTTLTPEVLWELTPWSWAVDWFSNAQQVVENFQNFKIYGEILRYGYMMEESTISQTYTMIESSGRWLVPLSSVAPVVISNTTKKRIKANPFGFGIGWEDLSPTQYAIAAALGITLVL